jgi:hypothetical protein
MTPDNHMLSVMTTYQIKEIYFERGIQLFRK